MYMFSLFHLKKVPQEICALVTRKHSSRIRTASLPIVHTSVATRWGSSSEQVWIGLQYWPPDVTGRVGAGAGVNGVPLQWGAMSGGRTWTRPGGGLYCQVSCIMGNCLMGPNCAQKDTTENITFPQLCWGPVKKIWSRLECVAKTRDLINEATLCVTN